MRGWASDPLRTALHAAVLTAVADRGLRATRVHDVLAEAGVDREAFYSVCSSLSDCFEAATAEARVRIRVAFDPSAAPGADDRERRASGLRSGLRALAADPAVATCLFVEAVYVRPAERHESHAPRVLDESAFRTGDHVGPAPALLRGYLAAVEQRIRDEVALGRIAQLPQLTEELVALGDRTLG